MPTSLPKAVPVPTKNPKRNEHMPQSEKQCSNIAEFFEKANSNDGKAFGYLEAKVTTVDSRSVNKKDGTTSIVTDLTLEDDTGEIVIAIWDTDQQWKADDVFSGTNLYTSTFKGNVQLNASRSSKISKKMASGKATQKPGAAKPGSTKSGSGGNTGSVDVSGIEKKIANMRGEVLNAITEVKVVILDQLKAVIDLVMNGGTGDQSESDGDAEGADQEEVGEEVQDEEGS
jgi:hypothetical protein